MAVDAALVQWSDHLGTMLCPALLPLVTPCATGSLLLPLLDVLHPQPAGPAGVRLLLTALAAAFVFWTTWLQPWVRYCPSHAAFSSAQGRAFPLGALGWILAVTALWSLLGGRPGFGFVPTIWMGLLLGPSVP
ncbi:hypothetical protein [Ralstonia solanacearum]|uniref:hypothetical protein n=1 Tax=Ralstonia solanacearum TaxID=305 RepID=UPI000A10FC69|nr:hypothetical protein [Ralstonia solanacearum]